MGLLGYAIAGGIGGAAKGAENVWDMGIKMEMQRQLDEAKMAREENLARLRHQWDQDDSVIGVDAQGLPVRRSDRDGMDDAARGQITSQAEFNARKQSEIQTEKEDANTTVAYDDAGRPLTQGEAEQAEEAGAKVTWLGKMEMDKAKAYNSYMQGRGGLIGSGLRKGDAFGAKMERIRDMRDNGEISEEQYNSAIDHQLSGARPRGDAQSQKITKDIRESWAKAKEDILSLKNSGKDNAAQSALNELNADMEQYGRPRLKLGEVIDTIPGKKGLIWDDKPTQEKTITLVPDESQNPPRAHSGNANGNDVDRDGALSILRQKLTGGVVSGEDAAEIRKRIESFPSGTKFNMDELIPVSTSRSNTEENKVKSDDPLGDSINKVKRQRESQSANPPAAPKAAPPVDRNAEMLKERQTQMDKFKEGKQTDGNGLPATIQQKNVPVEGEDVQANAAAAESAKRRKIADAQATIQRIRDRAGRVGEQNLSPQELNELQNAKLFLNSLS